MIKEFIHENWVGMGELISFHWFLTINLWFMGNALLINRNYSENVKDGIKSAKDNILIKKNSDRSNFIFYDTRFPLIFTYTS